MKKSLLFASLLALGVSSANAEYKAVTDGNTYDVIDGFKCQSMWASALYANPQNWNSLPFANSNYARTACIVTKEDGKDLVAVAWEQVNPDDNNTGTLANMTLFDLFTGEPLKTMELTVDGVQLRQLLGVNQVGCDDFGHVWVCGYVATPYNIESAKATPFKVYEVNLETGALTLAFEVELPADEKEATGRCDYYSLVGDITRTEAPCCFMASPNDHAGATDAEGKPLSAKPYVYGWRCEQGSDTFDPLMDDGSFVTVAIEETFPADGVEWGNGALVRIIKDEDYSAALYYTDGFITCPSIYDNAGGTVETFGAVADKELWPAVGTNGVGEFTINDVPFIFYSIEQYNDGHTCKARVAKLGDGSAFDGMTGMWELPKQGLGEISDGGARYHACETRVYTDGNGVEGAYLLSYKGRNGLAVYTVAPEEWENPNMGAVDGIIADEDSNAPIEYFNLNGVKVSENNLTPGLYITRQGSKAEKVVVR